MLYAHPTASVITNQNISPQFPLYRGTRQGDPLSPFLFALAIEPRATSIRRHPRISPVSVKGQNHQLSCGRHIALCVKTTGIYALNYGAVKHFGSGFQINWDKSELMPVYLNQNSSTLKDVTSQIQPLQKQG